MPGLNKKFEFSTAGRIIFGAGQIKTVAEIAPGLGNHALIVKGEQHPDPAELYTILEKINVSKTIFIVPHEPDLDLLLQAVNLGRKHRCDFVIGFGGGAPIDTGKAVAALLNNDGDVLDYLEVVGKGLPLQKSALPYVAIPTTAGTGSEVTRNAVIAIPEKRVKVSMRSAFLLPRVAIVDPELTYSVPPAITASTGMDAFTQVIEPYVTKVTNPMVDMLCRYAIPLAAKSLFRAYSEGSDAAARENIAYVSLLGGLSLANAKLGAVHGFAGPIGGMFNAPHGAICAALLPATLSVNAELLSLSDQNEEKTLRFQEIARWVTGKENAAIQDGVRWITNLAASMHIPGLAAFGISEKDFPEIIEKSQQSSSMKGNPITLTPAQMERILSMSM